MRSIQMFALLLVAALLLCTPTHAADRVTLKDGRVFVGTIVEDDDGELQFKTKVAGIPTTVSFRSAEIESIERDIDDAPTTPPTTPEPRDPADKPSSSTPDRSDDDGREDDASGFVKPTRFSYIPIDASIGIMELETKETPITAQGVEAALDKAKRLKIEHVVFHIKSGGGLIREGELIAEAIERHRTEFTYYALVERSISAAMAITLSCDHIYVTPLGSQGGALSFKHNLDTGSVKVDAKMNSIWSANLAAIAERNGHNPDITRAMVLPEMTLYSWQEHGRRIITDLEPEASPPDLWTLDASDEAVLTLSPADAVKLGFASAQVDSPGDIGALIGISEWKQHGRYGQVEIARATRQLIKDEKQRRKLIKDIESDYKTLVAGLDIVDKSVRRAHTKHPSRDTYSYRTRSGRLTGESITRWRRRTDEAIGAWNVVLGHISDIGKLTDRMKKNARASRDLNRYWAFSDQAEADEEAVEELYDDVLTHHADLRAVGTQANDEIKSLRADRDRSRL